MVISKDWRATYRGSGVLRFGGRAAVVLPDVVPVGPHLCALDVGEGVSKLGDVVGELLSSGRGVAGTRLDADAHDGLVGLGADRAGRAHVDGSVVGGSCLCAVAGTERARTATEEYERRQHGDRGE